MMSVLVVKEGKLKNLEDRAYYKVECKKCEALYVFDETDIINECRTTLSPYLPNGGVTEEEKHITCPCCSRVTHYQDFEKITKEDYDGYHMGLEFKKLPKPIPVTKLL